MRSKFTRLESGSFSKQDQDILQSGWTTAVWKTTSTLKHSMEGKNRTEAHTHVSVERYRSSPTKSPDNPVYSKQLTRTRLKLKKGRGFDAEEGESDKEGIQTKTGLARTVHVYYITHHCSEHWTTSMYCV